MPFLQLFTKFGLITELGDGRHDALVINLLVVVRYGKRTLRQLHVDIIDTFLTLQKF